MSINPILPHEFHTLSQQNTRLNQNLITITLNHEHLLEQNHKLSQQLKKKDYALIQSTLRQKNLDHSLNNVQTEYTRLQEQYQEVYNMMRTGKRLEMRDIYKKESQLALDMADIQRESYRESRKAKNQQLNQYQQRIISLVNENDSLKVKMLEMTSQYNTKLYDLKSANIQNEIKLNSMKSLQDKYQTQPSSTANNDIQTLQLQLKFQNIKEILEFYVKQNSQIKDRNIQLNAQVDKLLGELKQAEESQTKQENNQNELWRALNHESSSVSYITGVIDENSKLRKQIQEITNKYILLTETYPKLIDDFQTIIQLQENIHKFNQVKSIQTQLSETTIKCASLQSSLTQLQAKYLSELKTRQNLEYKSSILTKRFNEIFIRMNPYFDIYQYESLELDETMWAYFDEKKDYKQLKEYEGKVLGLKRELKQAQVNYESKQRQLKMQVEEKQREIARINKDKQQTQQKLNEISDSNNLLKKQLHDYQLSFGKIEEQQHSPKTGQQLSQKKLQHEITVPLLQQLIHNLHLQREELFKTIYKKDNTIAELTQQLHSTKLHQPIKTINLTLSQSQNPFSQLPSISVQFSQLLNQNQQLQRKYDQTVQKLSQQLKTLKAELNNQHNMYQMEVRKYEHQYETKLIEMKNMLDKWILSSEELRIKLQLEEQKKLSEKERNLIDLEKSNKKEQNLAINLQQGEMIEQNPSAINHQAQQANQQHIRQDNHIIRQPSYTNLQKLPLINNSQQGSSNKLIGQSTVQNLTQTLKKYEQDMNQVLAMCSKVSKDYSELKEKVKNQQQLERINLELTKQCSNLNEQLQQTRNYLNEKNLAISTLQTLYKVKSSYCDQINANTKKEHQLLQTKLSEQHKLTQTLTKQLQELKQKFYQLAARPSSAPEDASVMNKGEFETIVIMQANKNKEVSNLSQKNRTLEGKVHHLMKELNEMKLKEAQKKAQEVSPMERAEMKQLSSLLQGTNVIELVKRANQIIESQAAKDKQAQEQAAQQKEQGMQEEPEEGQHVQI